MGYSLCCLLAIIRVMWPFGFQDYRTWLNQQLGERQTYAWCCCKNAILIINRWEVFLISLETIQRRDQASSLSTRYPILKVSGDDYIFSKPQWSYCKCQPGHADVLQARLKGLSLYSNIIENRFIGLGRACVCASALVQFHPSLS